MRRFVVGAGLQVLLPNKIKIIIKKIGKQFVLYLYFGNSDRNLKNRKGFLLYFAVLISQYPHVKTLNISSFVHLKNIFLF